MHAEQQQSQALAYDHVLESIVEKIGAHAQRVCSVASELALCFSGTPWVRRMQETAAAAERLFVEAHERSQEARDALASSLEGRGPALESALEIAARTSTETLRMEAQAKLLFLVALRIEDECFDAQEDAP